MKINLNRVLEFLVKQGGALIDRIKAEPVLVRTFLTILISAGVLEITDARLDQIDSIVLVIVVLLGGVSARRKVTPNNKLQQGSKAAAKKPASGKRKAS